MLKYPKGAKLIEKGLQWRLTSNKDRIYLKIHLKHGCVDRTRYFFLSKLVRWSEILVRSMIPNSIRWTVYHDVRRIVGKYEMAASAELWPELVNELG